MCSYQPAPAIKTDRLTLRAPRAEDASRIAALCGDFEIPRMTTRMPWPYRLEDAQGFVGRMANANPDQDKVFMVEHPADGAIGAVGFHTHERHPELGYWLGRPYWGKGYATEAVRAALAWTRDGWKRKVVAAGHFADNPASGGVLIKSGFLYTGDVLPKHSVARGQDVPTRMMVWLA